MQLACSVTSGVGAPLVIHGSQGTMFVAQDSEAFNNTQMEVVPDRDYKDEFVKKTGGETLKIDVKPFVRGEHPHMDNFLEAVRGKETRTSRRSSATRRWRRSAWACRRIARAR